MITLMTSCLPRPRANLRTADGAGTAALLPATEWPCHKQTHQQLAIYSNHFDESLLDVKGQFSPSGWIGYRSTRFVLPTLRTTKARVAVLMR